MPSIMAVPYPTRGHVLVEVDFSDVPGAAYICVEAQNTVTGATRQLHPYVAYNGNGCLALSCGQAIFWDTEIPCDVAVKYCATAFNSSGSVITTAAQLLASDTFTRSVANGWGTADSGQAWSVSGGLAADYSVTGTRGQHSVTSTSTRRVSSISMPTPNLVAQATAWPAALALTSATEQWLMLRADSTGSNGYKARIRYTTAGDVDLILEKMIAGTPTSLALVSAFTTYTAASAITVKFQAWGSQLSVKAWDATSPEPPSYMIVQTDTTFLDSGTLNLASLRNLGNTNGTIDFQWDNLIASDVCAQLPAVQACTENVTIACDGCFRLGDPVRPCNDVKICLCADGVECGGAGGLFFAGMTADTYADNSGNVLPVNGKYPIHVSRTRRSASGSLSVVSTSFDARDDLLALLDSGGVLLWRGPAEYGTGDRYLAVGEVPVAPQISDLRIQGRLETLPFIVSQAPVGPSQGVCGARVADLCDVYATWDDLIAAGLTYADLLRGDASTPGSGLATWDSINSTYASWNALQAAQTDWSDVLDGD